MVTFLSFPLMRGIARFIDYLIWGMIFVVLIGYHLGNQDFYFIFLALFWIYPFIEALFIRCFKTTLGKKLFGISIENEDGTPLSYKQALLRSFLVFGAGFGFFLPTISLILPFYGFYRIATRQFLFWDKQSASRVVYKKTSLFDKLFLFFFALFLCMGWFSAIKKMWTPQTMELGSFEESGLEVYYETIRPKMLEALSVEAVLSPENAKASLRKLEEVKSLIQMQKVTLYLVKKEVQERINQSSSVEEKQRHSRHLHKISKELESFLFAESMRVALFESILTFFAQAEPKQVHEKDGKVFFKDKETQTHYNNYMFQLEVFLMQQ